MKTQLEYRVVWQREGLTPKSRLYKTLKGAEKRKALLLDPIPEIAKAHFTFQDLDGHYCCSGRECGCGGSTLREMLEYQSKDIPALQWVRIESREVGEWE